VLGRCSNDYSNVLKKTIKNKRRLHFRTDIETDIGINTGACLITFPGTVSIYCGNCGSAYGSLLKPEDYGLSGMVRDSLYISMFKDMGLSLARTKGRNKLEQVSTLSDQLGPQFNDHRDYDSYLTRDCVAISSAES